ncbi:TPA: hypothetical protein I4G69_000239 [Enterobacter asburiae]|nr:hypothetical protein [Enterobacter asburiae]
MWREAKIAFPDDISSMGCAVIPAHPWVYGLGQQTANGNYLSPVNAVSYLVSKLASMDNVRDVVIVMVASSSHDSFMSGLTQLCEVIPFPDLTQVKRLAQSTAELAREKMKIPAGYNSLPSAVPLSVPTSRAALAAAAVKAAGAEAAAGAGMNNLKKQLSDFAQLRDSMMSDIARGLSELQGKSARAWVFTGDGNPATTLAALVKDIPLPSAVHTAAILLAGDDLNAIKGMIHDIDPNAGA